MTERLIQVDEQHRNREILKLPMQPKTIEEAEIGSVTFVDLHSTLGPFAWAPNYETVLPPQVVEAIGLLIDQQTQAFSHLIARNTEKDTQAYAACTTPTGIKAEPFFQVDMVALSNDCMSELVNCSKESRVQMLKQTIFEFEPSIAMYELIQTFGGNGGLKAQFRHELDIIRQRHEKPIAILAPTVEKFAAILATEFGLPVNHGLSQQELDCHVKEVSGFDAVLSPSDFCDHISQSSDTCDVLLYVRPSDPIDKLRNPSVTVQEPLLENDCMRSIIRQHAITINIDNPAWSSTDPRRLKDTKAALPLLEMGHSIKLVEHLDRLPDQTELLRAKPRSGVFGGYGQETIRANKQSDRNWLANQIALRGTYLIQPEMAPLMVIDTTTGKQFLAMDRNFFSTVQGRPVFMGGIRILIPADSKEAQKGRLHGNKEMISAPVISG